jgi:molecular chaperone HscA
VRGSDLAGLFLVGGSSRVPLVARLLHGELGVAPTVLEQPELPVAEGALLAGIAVPEQRAPVSVAAEQPKYELGVAHAKTPTPTPSTLPNNRPPPASAPVSPSPHYAEPVDPWATGEAAALAGGGGGHPVFPGSPAPTTPPASESWLASADPGAATPPGSGDRGRRTWPYRSKVVLAAGLVVVLGLAATLVLIYWPRNRALEFTPLADAERFAPAVPMTSKFADAELLGDRAYFASTDDAGTLGVVAVDAQTGSRKWSSRAAGVAEQWDHMVALPEGLAAFTDTDTTTHQRRMAILGRDKGDLLWERSLGDDDAVYFVADVAVVADRGEHRLLGLEINGRGKTRWEIPDIKGDSGTATAIVPATTTDDLAGPATVGGASLAPDPGDDTRIVQISADRSARVIDAKSGDIVVQPRQSVADPDDEVIAHNGRLIVRESENAHRIMAYDLGRLGEPKSLYTAPDTTRQLTHLAACGADRICYVEAVGYADKTAQVASLDVTNGQRWTRSLPSTQSLVPVGDSVLAAQDTTPPRVSLLNAEGKMVWTREGEAARLNTGNMLLFLKARSDYPDDSFVWGDHVGDSAVPLGALPAVRSATCSWDTAMLACVTDKDFTLQRFAKS